MPFRRGAVHLCGIARNLCCGSAAVTGEIILRHDYTIFLSMPEFLAFYVFPHNCIYDAIEWVLCGHRVFFLALFLLSNGRKRTEMRPKAILL